MDNILFDNIISFIRNLYGNKSKVSLHSPVFFGNEKSYLADCIDSTFVSYVGKYVEVFEKEIKEYSGAKHAIAVVNGTAALKISLEIAGVKAGDEVITQPLTFVATANAISMNGAKPVFVDVSRSTLGLSPESLKDWLKSESRYDIIRKKIINKKTGCQISAIVPVHTYGHPCEIEEIINIAEQYELPVIEDAAESLGSTYNGKHTGTFGLAGILSFNGNKIITTGGGGIILTESDEFAFKAKHITTTAKIPHEYEFIHNAIGYNYRMTNLNAAVGVAQMENLKKYIDNKRVTARLYSDFFEETEYEFIGEPVNSFSNYWLNTIIMPNKESKIEFLKMTNENGIQTRPAWRLMNNLKMYSDCQAGSLDNSEYFEKQLVNLPSGYRVIE